MSNKKNVFFFWSDKNSSCYGSIYFNRLIMGKVEIDNSFLLQWGYLDFVYRNVYWVVY